MFGNDGDFEGWCTINSKHKLNSAGTEMTFMYCFTIAFNTNSYLCLRLQYCLSR